MVGSVEYDVPPLDAGAAPDLPRSEEKQAVTRDTPWYHQKRATMAAKPTIVMETPAVAPGDRAPLGEEPEAAGTGGTAPSLGSNSGKLEMVTAQIAIIAATACNWLGSILSMVSVAVWWKKKYPSLMPLDIAAC